MFLQVQSVFRPTTANILTRVSTAADGSQGNGVSEAPKFSPDGRYMVFSSSASNLVAGDTNDTSDLFRKDLMTGQVTRISTASDGTQANDATEGDEAHLSSDGRYVVFSSSASNLVSGDDNNLSDIFLKDMVTGAITCLSTRADGTQANQESRFAQFSSDGRYVLFHSDASNLVDGDTNDSSDIFLKDLSTGQVTRVSTKADGTQSNNSSSYAQFSADGRYVLFESDASDLVAGDTNNRKDIFLKNHATGEITRVSTAADGTQGNARSMNASLSANGRYVLFESEASNLVSGDTNGSADVFRKDVITGEITRVSTATTGEQGNSDSYAYSYGPEFSADGRYVVFDSRASNFVPGDTNGVFDIFRKDLVTGELTLLSVAADGTHPNNYSYYYETSADGRYAMFSSNASNLIADDTNNSMDIFRVDLLYKANAAAIAQGRYIETTLGVGAASSVTVAWGDGTSSTVAPKAGQASLSHTYAATGAKAAIVTLVEGALTWNVAHTIDIGASTMVRNTGLADTLSGGAGRDSLTGDAFVNILVGNASHDRLSSGAGNDTLSGGTGTDTLTGSTGRDVFVFDDRETSSSKTKADYITDFSGRQGDRIDLKAVDANTKKRGDQKFSFIGDEKSFSKAGEVRFEKTKSATYVYLNTDTDKSAEAVIKLKGAIDLSKGWFVL
ncbi:PD40 domain-containing protein [Microvirga sp. BT689]|uniref:PD40 domain-containing protein n=1 Tax=Microvirga arvi TaxID=2778731 RepID=UPI001951EFC6|nr:PD40 domain-containing protein [Microvirga arvi]MBM6583382.1 PD40 domain-containing protein [Microvirga arvi]